MKRAVILAAGRGTRMGALTEDLPKPMLPVRGKPMLERKLPTESPSRFYAALVALTGAVLAADRDYARAQLA